MAANCNPQPSLLVYGDPINHVTTDFKYLGSKTISAANDLKRRKALAWSAFLETGKTVEWFPTIHLCESGVILHHLCDIFFLFSCESWVLSLDMKSKINDFATFCYRIMLGIKRQDCISNIAIYSMTNPKPPVYYVRKRQLGFLGHILRLPVEEPARICVFMYHLKAKGTWVVFSTLTLRTSSRC